MKISIIVPAFNEEKLLGATLRAVREATAAFTEKGWLSELIVCDNNSTDRTAEIARAAGATVVFEPVNQIGRARNCGASAASGDWLIFVDADSHPGRGLFADVASAIESGRCLAGGATMKLDGHYPIVGLIARFWNVVSRIKKYVAGSFIFCEASTFRQMGGFDTRYFAGEELNLSLRLKRVARERGKRVVILHRHPLVTSARKVHLYSLREHLRFLSRTVWKWGGTLGDREACHTWYDGRR